MAGNGLRVRPDIYDKNASIGLDAIIVRMATARKLAVGFHDVENAIAFGRRALEVSAISALDEVDTADLSESFARWKDLAATLGRARLALDAVLTATGAADPTVLPALIRKSVSHRYLRQQDVSQELRDREQAPLSAAAFRRTAAVLVDLEAMATEIGDRAAGFQNPGEPVKAAFVDRMAEAWVALTGELPGANKTLEGNAFMKFAAVGWSDMGGDFGSTKSIANTIETILAFAPSATKDARKRLAALTEDERKNYRPWWL